MQKEKYLRPVHTLNELYNAYYENNFDYFARTSQLFQDYIDEGNLGYFTSEIKADIIDLFTRIIKLHNGEVVSIFKSEFDDINNLLKKFNEEQLNNI